MRAMPFSLPRPITETLKRNNSRGVSLLKRRSTPATHHGLLSTIWERSEMALLGSGLFLPRRRNTRSRYGGGSLPCPPPRASRRFLWKARGCGSAAQAPFRSASLCGARSTRVGKGREGKGPAAGPEPPQRGPSEPRPPRSPCRSAGTATWGASAALPACTSHYPRRLKRNCSHVFRCS